MELVLENVFHRYAGTAQVPDVVSVRGLDVKAKAGEISVLFGGSGCGKSTILNLIAGLLETEQGDIRIQTEEKVRDVERVSFVFQSPTLIPWLSVRDNALFSTVICESNPSSPHAFDDMQRLLERFGIADKQDLYPRSLSGGMQQRVALARAILADAYVLLLDEPFSNSDFVMRRALHSELQEAVEERDLIAVLVTHDVTDAALLGDQIYVLTPSPASVAFSFKNPVSRAERQSGTQDAITKLAGVEHTISQELIKAMKGA